MEKEVKLTNNGFVHLFLGLGLLFVPLCIIADQSVFVIVLTIILSVIGIFWLTGLFIVQPNQTRVLLFFGKYKGTVKQNGFFWLNPFYSKKKVSLRVRNLESDIIKVNDEQGNPILISGVVVWKIVDTYKAVFDIETKDDFVDAKTGKRSSNMEDSYQNFVKIQTESALRSLAHSYPYDDVSGEENTDTITLRSGVDVINETLVNEIKERLKIVGIEVLEARISNLSYAPEIASVMLQRQQAQAVIVARTRIVEGAVGMVEMAVEQLEAKSVAKFSDEEKSKMVNNLMVVLCGNQGTKPVLNLD